MKHKFEVMGVQMDKMGKRFMLSYGVSNTEKEAYEKMDELRLKHSDVQFSVKQISGWD